MIVRLTGTLIEIEQDAVVVEREGVAREVLVPGFALVELAAYRGQVVTLHTTEFFEGNHNSGHMVPRLLGFLHSEDRAFFAKFVSVKGIGPKKALKALSEPVRRIADWIESGDAKSLSRLPGIGARASELIIASLKGKLEGFAMRSDGADSQPANLSTVQRDALEILVAWGDSRNEAEQLIQRAAQLHPDLDSADEWVRKAYRIKSGVEV